MDYRIEEAIAEDFMYEYQFVEYMVIHEYKNDNKLMYRNRISHLLDWAYINIAKGYSTPVSDKPKPNNILTENDIKTFEEFYINVLFPAHYNRNKNYLLYYGKDNAHNGFRFIDVTSKAFGANDDFNEGSKIKLDKYNF
ncbi:MAG: hypothetical protein IPK18_11765 [Sphingobacteriales bacterium]|jgi:hypothetical protein|nr:MAG: hypothetical protein IPK18_11765 [Sphingobacteriales bacterium]